MPRVAKARRKQQDRRVNGHWLPRIYPFNQANASALEKAGVETKREGESRNTPTAILATSLKKPLQRKRETLPTTETKQPAVQTASRFQIGF